eukprot:605046-Prorocentrum_lima.AAC.1
MSVAQCQCGKLREWSLELCCVRVCVLCVCAVCSLSVPARSPLHARRDPVRSVRGEALSPLMLLGVLLTLWAAVWMGRAPSGHAHPNP